MRFKVYKYFLNMCDVLNEAAQYLKKEIEFNINNNAVDSEIRNNGVVIINKINDIVNTIENQEIKEKIDNLLNSWNELKVDDVIDNINEIKSDFIKKAKYKVRVVFYAEIGEKWDAMSSVYEYISKDDRFDVQIVRTPVFREVENNGEKKREIIYKDFLTPMGIPSIACEKYNLSEDFPDMVIITQPYEGVTLKAFWPDVIAKFTKLVYMSYYIPGVITDERKQALCDMNVYRCAWKVIGTGDKHYDLYKNNRHNHGSNMIVTGLPKWDEILKIKNKNVELPDGWSEKLSGKKVFLWNTVYSIGMSSYRFCKEIYEWFSNHKDCVLIWRKHPMTDTVSKLYYSENVYLEYLKIVKIFEAAPNIIVDKEVSCDAAFYYSDAMISDMSSLIYQYLFMDKPVLYVRTGWLNSDGKEDLIDLSWTDETEDEKGIVSFLEKIYSGEDGKSAQRKEVVKRDMPLADGHCGERVAETLYEAFIEEELGNL